MATRIRIRRGDAAWWTASNPVLGLAEFGHETDTGKRKIGDGVLDWNALAYESTGGAGLITSVADTATIQLAVSVGGQLTANYIGAGGGTSDVFYIPLAKQGATNNYTGTAAGLTAYTSNAVYFFVFDIAPTGAPVTADINGLGVVTFKRPNGATNLPSNAVASPGVVYEFAYNGTSWVPEAKINITESGGTDLVVGTTPISNGTVGALLYEGSGNVLQENAANLFWDNTNSRLGIGINVPTATLEIKSSDSTSATFPLLVRNSIGNGMFCFRSDGAWVLGLNTENYLPNMSASDVNIHGAIGATSVARTAVNGTADGAYATALGAVSNANGAGAQAIGSYCYAHAAAGIAVGMSMESAATGAIIIGSDYNANIINAVPRSFMVGLGGNSGVLHKQSFFVNWKTNIVLRSEDTITDGTHYDSYATNILTIHNPLTAAVLTITSVTTNGGVATFNHAGSNTPLTGDMVITSGFGVYANQTYWIQVTGSNSVYLHTSRADSLTSTNPVAFISNDTGTITPQPRKTTSSIVNAAQLYTDDNGAGNASLFGWYENGMKGMVVLIETKTTAGDPTGYEGRMVINTNDNTVKMYADAGWRTLASGW